MTAWLVVQVVETLFSIYGISEAAIRMVVTLLGIGFVPALFLAWAFELTPEGIRREENVDHSQPVSLRSARRIDRLIIVVLALALGYFAVDKFVLSESREDIIVKKAREEGRTEALVKSFGDKSIAVLPFTNLSSDPEQEYFSDGIAEEMLNMLARIPELRVTSRSSSFSFKGQNVDVGEVAERLNVAHVLEGSVQKSGNHVRINVQLIDARSDTNLWSNSWNRTLDDIFAIQDEIAVEVVNSLQLALLNPVPTSRRTDPEAFALTLRANQLLELRVSELTKRAEVLLDRALELDPNYISAMHLKLRVIYLSVDRLGKEEADRRWVETGERILAVDPDDAIWYAYLAYEAFWPGRNPETALAQYQRVLHSEPNNSEILRQAGGVARRLGYFDQSLSLLRRAVELDPLCLNCLWHLKESYLAAGQLHDAERIELKQQALGGNRGIHYLLLKLMQGDTNSAKEVVAGFGARNLNHDVGQALLQHALGNQAGFEAAIEHLIKEWGDQQPYNVAQVYAYADDKDAAFDWLERVIAEDEQELYKNVFSPFWHNLRGDPRWEAVRERLGLSAERLAAIDFEVSLPD